MHSLWFILQHGIKKINYFLPTIFTFIGWKIKHLYVTFIVWHLRKFILIQNIGTWDMTLSWFLYHGKSIMNAFKTWFRIQNQVFHEPIGFSFWKNVQKNGGTLCGNMNFQWNSLTWRVFPINTSIMKKLEHPWHVT